MKRIGIVAAAVLPMVVAAVAPAATAGQRIDRVGFLVAGLLAGFGLTRLTGWLDPRLVVGRAAAVATGGDAGREAVPDGPAERPVLFDHDAVEAPETVALAAVAEPAVEPVEDVAAEHAAAEPVAAGDGRAAPASETTRPAKGKRKGSSKAARRAAAPAAVVAPAETAHEPAIVSEPAPVAGAATAADATTASPGDEPPVPAAAVDDVDERSDGAPTGADRTDEVDAVDIVGIAARTLASQLAPGNRAASSALSALDATRAPARPVASARSADKARPVAEQPAATPVRGAAPKASPSRGRTADPAVTGEEATTDARPAADAPRVEAADVPETSVVELLAKRAASTGSSVWSLAMNGTGGGPASWALAPNAEAARKAAEEAVREAVDNAGRAESEPAADAAERGTSPIVGRVPRRDR